MDKRIKKGSAVLTAWTLIAVMGIAPVGTAFPAYASVAEQYDSEINAADRSETRKHPDIAEEENREMDNGELEEEKTEEESPERDETKEEQLEETEEDQKTESNEETEGSGETEGAGETDEGEETELPDDITAATPSEAVPKEEEILKENEPQTATPSNALLMAGDLWGGIEMSDHFDGEGTKEAPYLLRNDKDLKLLAYQVANEEVDGYEGCYFELTKDISLNDSASWLPIGYYRSRLRGILRGMAIGFTT